MKSAAPYELALLQFRPDVTSEELLNVGVVGFGPRTGEFHSRITERYSRLKAVYPNLNGSAYRAMAYALQSKATSLGKSGENGQPRLLDNPNSIEQILQELLPLEGNFRWSAVRYGVCPDLAERVDEVFGDYVAKHEQTGRDRIDDDRLWKGVNESAAMRRVAHHVDKPKVISAQGFTHTFRASWVNGTTQVAEPISLDYVTPSGMVEQAVHWKGIIGVLAEAQDFRLTAIVTDPPTDDSLAKYNAATALLLSDARVRAVIPASDADRLAQMVREDLGLSADGESEGSAPS